MPRGRPRVEKLVNDHPLYAIWCMIKQRCNNPKHPAYIYYGARGIKLHPEWSDDFYSFVKYVGNRPSKKHSIDRYPDKNGNYEPGNIRWATLKEQAQNRNKRHTFKKAANNHETK